MSEQEPGLEDDDPGFEQWKAENPWEVSVLTELAAPGLAHLTFEAKNPAVPGKVLRFTVPWPWSPGYEKVDVEAQAIVRLGALAHTLSIELFRMVAARRDIAL